jgi:predicted RNA-binding protein with PUA-like domain
MAGWPFKQEPDCSCYADLERDGRTLWDGVSNPQALKYLRTVRPGDRLFFSHTGKEKAIVGEMRVVGGPRPDPALNDPRRLVVEVEAVRALPRPVPLSVIKEDATLSGWDLVRLPRLSVMPVSEAQWRRVLELAGPRPRSPTRPTLAGGRTHRTICTGAREGDPLSVWRAS